ncbi:MAG: 7-carboxy-7-deazaguanine synthase QueE [Puniceicoccaceae bacterium]|nr:MAG: 7-carboxy-7-deazaguanine synthase QueE [Puniceicoccaceae bacterium]
MRIAEIFHSLQGEGSLIGTPSIFIRTSGCNLRCVWCDTPYASWKPEGPDLSIAEILARVDALPPARHIVLTGGEPMVAKGIHELAAALAGRGHHLSIETAGTLPPAGIDCDLASLSPKLANSAPGEAASPAWRERHEALRLQPAVLDAWIQNYSVQFKFVVRSPEELAEIDALLGSLARPPDPHQIFLMPEGTDAAILQARTPALVQACLARGFRFAPRLHIELFGNTRGT